MFLSKIVLLIALEAAIFLIVGNVAFVLLFLSQKKKNTALKGIAGSVNQPIVASVQQPADEKASYQVQIEESLKQLSDSLPGLMPCSDPHAFATASDQEQAKIIRYLVLDYEKQIIDNIEAEDGLAAPFVASVNQLFPDAPAETSSDEAEDKSESSINAEIEQLSNQNKMNQGVIDQFARESREMLSCINTLESENQDLRKLIEVKAGRQ